MNSILKKVSFLGMLGMFFLSPMLHAQIKEVFVEANGLYCDVCTYAVSRQLRVLPGVDKVDLLLHDGGFRITLKEGAPFQPEEFIRVLGKSSYNYTGMKLLVEGELGNQGSGKTLSVPANKVTFRIEPGDEMTVRAQKVLDSSNGQAVTIVGNYKKNPESSSLPILSVESAEKGSTTQESLFGE